MGGEMLPGGGHDMIHNGKSGTTWTAVGHIFCVVVGAGVLGLPNSMAWLGWVAGPICLILFFAVSLWCSHLLVRLYEVDGIEFNRYQHAVRHILGRKGAIAAMIFQLLNLVLVDIAYSITGAVAMQTVAPLIGSSFNKEWQLVLLMGAFELVLSQVPSMEEVWWVSAIGTLSSLGYVTIALVLGLIYSGNRLGSVSGRSGTSDADKTFGMLNALGNIAFAFSFANVLLEIQATLRQPPPAQRSMHTAVRRAVTGAFFLYFSTAVTCYSALGNDVPGMVLQGFPEAPNWVLVLANIFIAIHMIMAWQVLAQPVFETIESNVKAYQLRRRKRATAAALDTPAVPLKPEAVKLDPHTHQLSPFDRVASAAPPRELHLSPPVAVVSDLEGADMVPALSGRLSAAQSGSALDSRRMLAHPSTSGDKVVVTTMCAPIPGLVPEGREPLRYPSTGKPGEPASGAMPGQAQRNSISEAGSALCGIPVIVGHEAMYHVNTGATNEHMPANDQGWYLPLWQRLIIRSAYVCICTSVALALPFFNAVVGLVGAITFWPLTVGFPMAMYIKVYKVTGFQLHLMYATLLFMLLVAIAATIASCQNIIVSASTYTFFS